VTIDDPPEIEAPDTSAPRNYDDDILSTRRDPDEAEQEAVLEVDQTELEELGLVLDDPHDPGLDD
jgi:hypothetical protein